MTALITNVSRALAALLAALALPAMAGAEAPPAFEGRSPLEVRLSVDLDALGNPLTRAQEKAALRRQAMKACRVPHPVRVLGSQVDEACVDEVIAAVMARTPGSQQARTDATQAADDLTAR